MALEKFRTHWLVTFVSTLLAQGFLVCVKKVSVPSEEVTGDMDCQSLQERESAFGSVRKLGAPPCTTRLQEQHQPPKNTFYGSFTCLCNVRGHEIVVPRLDSRGLGRRLLRGLRLKAEHGLVVVPTFGCRETRPTNCQINDRSLHSVRNNTNPFEQQH